MRPYKRHIFDFFLLFLMIYAYALFCINGKFETRCFWRIDLLDSTVKPTTDIWMPLVNRICCSCRRRRRRWKVAWNLILNSLKFETKTCNLLRSVQRKIYICSIDCLLLYCWNGSIVFVIRIIKKKPCLYFLFQLSFFSWI